MSWELSRDPEYFCNIVVMVSGAYAFVIRGKILPEGELEFGACCLEGVRQRGKSLSFFQT